MSTISGVARQAVPYGLPMVDLHRILVNFALDPSSPEFKAPLNHVHHSRGLADPSDLSVVAMNVDTPYSWAWLDLRGGPVLLTLPAHETDRYMSAQVNDLYTNIVGYVSPRTVGDEGGTFLVRGPAGGETRLPVDGVLDCPTDLAVVLIRTQLFSDADLPNVHALQDGVRVTALGEAPPFPETVPPVDVRAPLGTSFLEVLRWMLHFMPPLAEDREIREELGGLGIGVGLLDAVLGEPAVVQEITEGLALGIQDVQERCASVRSSAEIFGSREFFGDDYLTRAAGTYLGILGNAGEEYLGIGYQGDAEGRPFDGSHRYTIRFAPDQLPEVGAFWSITLYDAESHLYANRLDRYVLGSRQLEAMVRDAGGVITLMVQHADVEPSLEPNWLPCPAGPFLLTFRTYLPGATIRDGSWTAPPVRRAG